MDLKEGLSGGNCGGLVHRISSCFVVICVLSVRWWKLWLSLVIGNCGSSLCALMSRILRRETRFRKQACFTVKIWPLFHKYTINHVIKPSIVLVAVILLALSILGHFLSMWKWQVMSSGNSAWSIDLEIPFRGEDMSRNSLPSRHVGGTAGIPSVALLFWSFKSNNEQTCFLFF